MAEKEKPSAEDYQKEKEALLKEQSDKDDDTRPDDETTGDGTGARAGEYG